MTTIRAYSIQASDIAAERKRVGDDLPAFDVGRILKLDTLALPALAPDGVRLRILAFAMEHNLDHAAQADTVNIAELRGGKMFPGNSAVGEVVEVGAAVKRFRVGDIAITHCLGEEDPYGYPSRIWAYDKPDSIGWYSEEAVVGEWQIIPAPLACGLSLWEIAALPLRAPTAYHLWRRGHDLFRVKVPREKLGRLNVLGFGGGVSELFLMLARSEGHRAFFCSGSPERRKHLESLGIESFDQKKYNRFATAADIKAFQADVKQRTDAVGMHVVCDMLRGPVFEAGLTVQARQGVNVSSGWQIAKKVFYDSANLSVRQITVDHMHYETIAGCHAATELYGSVFRPTVHREIYSFADVPRALKEMHDNVQTGIPIIRVPDRMPAAVAALV
ncbi:MAG TPA: zinc-binding alcohol dehydrogenase family protein [Candidatus Binatia bacterium]|nr:zinc-binding alcohol dehydrogenase family protein [Candidatus Binatia bacterium]